MEAYNDGIMSSLSIKLDATEDDPKPKAMVACASPVFLLADFNPHVGDKVEFEVLDSNATQLKNLVGTTQTFGLEGQAFVAEVTELKPRVSTVNGLSMMRDVPAMHGVLTIKSLAA
jgi:hypothetical protein